MQSAPLSILFVTNNYTPYSSGLVSSIDAFCAALRLLGHTVHIVTLDFAQHPHDNPQVIRIRCPLKFTYRKNPMALPQDADQALEHIIEQIKPDIVHTQHPFLLGVNAYRACKKYNVPLVFTHHTQYEYFAHYVPAPAVLTRPIINHLVTSFCNKVDTVIAPSQSIKMLLEQRAVTTPIEVIASPIRATFANMLEIQKPPKSDQRWHLLYVGRFVPEKNISFLLRACAHLPHGLFDLTLAGYGYQESELREKILTLDIDAHIIARPKPEQLVDLYMHADTFVFASTTETQAIVLAEAMAASTPVIACHGPGQNDIVCNGHNGFLVDNETHMAQVIIQLANDTALAQRLQTGARETARAYTTSSLVHKLVAVYQATMAAHPCYTERYEDLF